MKQLLTIVLLLQTCLVVAQLQPGKNVLMVSGEEVWVYTPANYNAATTYPIVFELHGMGQTKDTMDDQEVVNEQQYIAVYPEGVYSGVIGGSFWNTWSETSALTSTNHVSFLTNVYHVVKQKVGAAFDANKVFVYGYSNGGAMAMKMLEETTLFKGAVIRSMTLKKGHTISATASKVPMVFIHGVEDATVRYTGGTGDKPFSPDFMDVKTAVKQWAVHNGATTAPMDVKYLATASLPEFWFREYNHSSMAAPVYLYAVVGAGHNVFTSRNIKRTAIRLFKNPVYYGFRKGNGS